ncbi:MAG: serine/threonine protein kinase [Blastocatellia bacterium]|nr:serine/threonine protein kinase [Blastocatellia bacterium]
MGRCVNCGNIFSDEVLFCPKDGEFALLDVVLKDTYLIKEKLGEGGMAMVFKATNILTNSICAIKIIHPDMLESELNAVERLLLEAVKIKKIAHPNIVKVLDFGPLNDGELVYLTMELLKGRTLKQEIIQKGPINYKKVAFLIEQVCAAIAAAHERGIIHRDIKPENIFLLEDIKDNILLKVLDFGISTDHVTQFTGAAKQIIGTPEYMSPEQCEAHKNLDVRSDIYNLGVTLYEMLTGRVPFPIAFWEPYEVLRKQMFEDPEPLTSLRPDIPVSVEKVVLKALEKKS